MQTELNKVVAALQEFYARRGFLLEKDLGERTLTHRLAVHLEKQFPGWEVDCDYDRLGERTLRLPHGTDRLDRRSSAANRSIPISSCTSATFPNNLLAIEVRKATNHQPLEHDQHKLRALTDPHRLVRLLDRRAADAGQEAVTSSEVYVGGVVDQPLSLWFAARLKEAGLDKG